MIVIMFLNLLYIYIEEPDNSFVILVFQTRVPLNVVSLVKKLKYAVDIKVLIKKH